MPRLRRTGTLTATEIPASVAVADPSTMALPADLAHLRDEADPDPLIEDAAERLRAALVTLDARDEWGRTLAWRQVARIALGPLLIQLRDAQTAARLMAATQPAPEPVETRDVVMDVIQAMLAEIRADDMPFWPA